MLPPLRPLFRRTSYLLAALRLIWQSAPAWTLALLTLLILQGILPLASLYLTRQIIDQLGPSLLQSQSPSVHAVLTTLRSLLPLLSLAGVIALANLLFTSLSELINIGQSERVTNAILDQLHAKSIAVDLAFYENATYFDALQRAQKEAATRPQQLLTALASVIKSILLLVGLTGLLLTLHWSVGIGLCLAALPVALTRTRYTSLLYNWSRRRTPLLRQAFYTSQLLTSDQHAKEIRIFTLGDLLRQRFRQLKQQLYQERLSVAGKQVTLNLVAQLLSGGFLLMSYGYVVYQAMLGNVTLGGLALYYQALQRGQGALRQFFSSGSRLYENNLFLRNLFEFLALQPTIVDPPKPLPLPDRFQQGILFENVSFGYPGTPRQALDNISLRVEPGETIALVGENGSGKTTLIKLLCRLYEPTAGHIHLEGNPLHCYALDDLRRQISVIFQDYAKYHLTVQENIGLGNADRHHDLEAIRAAAERSGADTVIQQLPDGYDTQLGKYFNRGEELSIGQWQKIALARAFLRESQILVLDEPTAAMDPKAEYAVFQQLQKLAHDKAVVLISHRMSTVRMCDRIYVMDQGRIIEWGSHEALMQQNGHYAHLFETQAQNYR